MYVESCTILVVVNHLSSPVVVLDGLPGLYGFKYDSASACGLPLYLYSYKLVGSAIACGLGTRVGLQEFAPLLLELWPEVPPIVPLALLRIPIELSPQMILYA